MALADGNCKSCVDDAYIHISYDDGVTWLELPAIQKITKSFNEETANETRHSGSGGAFVKPCGADSRTDVYTVQHLVCDSDPIEWYLQDGDPVPGAEPPGSRPETLKFRIVKGHDATHVQFADEFDGKYIEGGFNWDNTSKDGEERTFTIERTGTLTRYYPDSPVPGTDPYFYGDGASYTPATPSNA